MEVQLDLSNRENGPSTTERAAGKLNRLYGSMGRPPSLPLYLKAVSRELECVHLIRTLIFGSHGPYRVQGSHKGCLFVTY